MINFIKVIAVVMVLSVFATTASAQFGAAGKWVAKKVFKEGTETAGKAGTKKAAKDSTKTAAKTGKKGISRWKKYAPIGGEGSAKKASKEGTETAAKTGAKKASKEGAETAAKTSAKKTGKEGISSWKKYALVGGGAAAVGYSTGRGDARTVGSQGIVESWLTDLGVPAFAAKWVAPAVSTIGLVLGLWMLSPMLFAGCRRLGQWLKRKVEAKPAN